MTLDVLVNVFGGLALFLLAMAMMTDGLTDFAGSGVRTLLGRWTSTPLRGVGSGILITGLVQSSSAVVQRAYGHAKQATLEAAVARQLTIEATDGLLDALATTRRAVEQLVKAGRLLHGQRPEQPLPAEMAENGAVGM